MMTLFLSLDQMAKLIAQKFFVNIISKKFSFSLSSIVIGTDESTIFLVPEPIPYYNQIQNCRYVTRINIPA